MKLFNAIKAQVRHNIHVHIHVLVLYCMSWNEASKSNLLWYYVNFSFKNHLQEIRNAN